MKRRRKQIRTLTDQQERFVQLLAEDMQKHKTEQLTRGELFKMAGSKTKTPDIGAAQEMSKQHVRDRLTAVLSAKYGIEPEPEPVHSEQEEAEANLKAWSTQSSQGANNYALYLLKKKEAGIIENTVRRVLMSSFLSEDELDDMGSKPSELPDDVTLAGKKARHNGGGNAKSPVNIEETA